MLLFLSIMIIVIGFTCPPTTHFKFITKCDSLLRSRCENATPNLCWVSVHYWVSCAINKGGFFEIAFVVVVVDTHLPHFDPLTHVVIRVSSAFIFQTFAEVCYSVLFVIRSSFKSVLNLRKAYIF